MHNLFPERTLILKDEEVLFQVYILKRRLNYFLFYILLCLWSWKNLSVCFGHSIASLFPQLYRQAWFRISSALVYINWSRFIVQREQKTAMCLPYCVLLHMLMIVASIGEDAIATGRETENEWTNEDNEQRQVYACWTGLPTMHFDSSVMHSNWLRH